MVEHVPVLLNEVIEMLSPKGGGVYFDGTFGGGGYARAILDAANCTVIACDRDPFVKKIAANFTNEYKRRFFFLHAKFSEIKSIVESCGNTYVDGVVLDLGVSNFQISDPKRGFSFKFNSPLDMSMGLCKENALNVLYEYSEKEIADIIFQYGEEFSSRRIAKAIKANLAQIKSTEDLANIVRKCVKRKGKIDQATKTFQALRIFVNDELGELEKVLHNAVDVLKPNGKIIVVSFHSLEDRIVKCFFKSLTIKENLQFYLLNKKPITPSKSEIIMNPRARSAKLRGVCML